MAAARSRWRLCRVVQMGEQDAKGSGAGRRTPHALGNMEAQPPLTRSSICALDSPAPRTQDGDQHRRNSLPYDPRGVTGKILVRRRIENRADAAAHTARGCRVNAERECPVSCEVGVRHGCGVRSAGVHVSPRTLDGIVEAERSGSGVGEDPVDGPERESAREHLVAVHAGEKLGRERVARGCRVCHVVAGPEQAQPCRVKISSGFRHSDLAAQFAPHYSAGHSGSVLLLVEYSSNAPCDMPSRGMVAA